VKELFGRLFAPIVSEWAELIRFMLCTVRKLSVNKNATSRSQNRCSLIVVSTIVKRCNGAIGQSRPVNKSQASSWSLRGCGEMFGKGRAKSRESGSILANARNNITRNVVILHTKVYPIHEGHTCGNRSESLNLHCMLYNTKYHKNHTRKSGK